MAYFIATWSLPMDHCSSLHHIPVLQCGLHLPEPNRNGEEKGRSSCAIFTTGGLGAPRTPFSDLSFPFHLPPRWGSGTSHHHPMSPTYSKSTALLSSQSPRQPLLLYASLLPHAHLPLNSGTLRGCIPLPFPCLSLRVFAIHDDPSNAAHGPSSLKVWLVSVGECELSSNKPDSASSQHPFHWFYSSQIGFGKNWKAKFKVAIFGKNMKCKYFIQNKALTST